VHELGIASAVVDACAERAAGARVLRVRIEVGQLTAVLPDALRFAFEVCAQGTALEGAELDIVELPGRATWETCGDTVTLSIPYGLCVCGGRLRLISGEELRVKEMEVA
jgi:hydrogenase nickel incorporation protein HypA/HybF